MAEHEETLIEKVTERIHGDSSSSSDSDDDKPSHADALKSKVYRLFGRDKPIHHVLGAGKRTHNFSKSDYVLTYSAKSFHLLLLLFLNERQFIALCYITCSFFFLIDFISDFFKFRNC